MDVTELKADFVVKYNRLFTEVATYYGIETKIFFWCRVLATIDITKIGYKHERLTHISKSLVYKFLSENYPHLEPFYHFFYNLRDSTVQDVICKGNLGDINIAVKAIRKVKQDVIALKNNLYNTYTKTNTDTSTNPCGEIFLDSDK